LKLLAYGPVAVTQDLARGAAAFFGSLPQQDASVLQQFAEREKETLDREFKFSDLLSFTPFRNPLSATKNAAISSATLDRLAIALGWANRDELVAGYDKKIIAAKRMRENNIRFLERNGFTKDDDSPVGNFFFDLSQGWQHPNWEWQSVQKSHGH
jgi:hypothetical protein